MVKLRHNCPFHVKRYSPQGEKDISEQNQPHPRRKPFHKNQLPVIA
jgi:hypothetical protein